jgi:hypothetical protein
MQVQMIGCAMALLNGRLFRVVGVYIQRFRVNPRPGRPRPGLGGSWSTPSGSWSVRSERVQVNAVRVVPRTGRGGCGDRRVLVADVRVSTSAYLFLGALRIARNWRLPSERAHRACRRFYAIGQGPRSAWH